MCTVFVCAHTSYMRLADDGGKQRAESGLPYGRLLGGKQPVPKEKMQIDVSLAESLHFVIICLLWPSGDTALNLT